jgi:hypothetical protein
VSGSSHTVRSEPAAVYLRRRDRFGDAAARQESRSKLLSWARLLTGLVIAAAIVGVVATASNAPLPWIVVGGVGTAVFAALVIVHERVIRSLERWKALTRIQEEGLARLARRWTDLPPPGTELAPHVGGLAHDLQLDGPASILHLLSAVCTPPGRETLAGWLAAPAAPEEIARRQRLVAALAPALELRQELILGGRGLADLGTVEPFLRWAEGDGWLRSRPLLLWTARLLPVGVWSTAGLAFAGLAPAPLPVALALVSFALAGLFADRLEEQHGAVAAREREMASYAAAISLLWSRDAAEVEPAALAELRRGLAEEGASAAEHMLRLQRRLDLPATFCLPCGGAEAS